MGWRRCEMRLLGRSAFHVDSAPRMCVRLLTGPPNHFGFILHSTIVKRSGNWRLSAVPPQHQHTSNNNNDNQLLLLRYHTTITAIFKTAKYYYTGVCDVRVCAIYSTVLSFSFSLHVGFFLRLCMYIEYSSLLPSLCVTVDIALDSEK